MNGQVHAPSPNGGKLLVAIVGREQGEKIVALTKNAGAGGGEPSSSAREPPKAASCSCSASGIRKRILC